MLYAKKMSQIGYTKAAILELLEEITDEELLDLVRQILMKSKNNGKGK